MENYFILNRATGKLEAHFEKAAYDALTEAQKKDLKSNFLWGRNSGCWISRAKWPGTGCAARCAAALGLQDAGETGERTSFAEQMERKAARAERRAERYENRADAHATRADHLQAPINHMHGDIAFFTQPNIGTSAGRAFTRRREKMLESFEKGFEEFNKSEYWRDRAQTARRAADQKELRDRAFLDRRIRERESDIRKLQKNVQGYEDMLKTAEGERAETISAQLERWLDMLEAKLDELGYYQDCLDAVGGIPFSRETIKPGYTVEVQRYGVGKVLSTGPKNFTFGSVFPLKMQYAEIIRVVDPAPAPEEKPPTLAEFAATFAP